MSRDEIINILIETISEIQKLTGRSDEPILPTTKPLENLEDFDSLNAFEVTVEISEKIGMDIDVGIFGIFPNKKVPKKITIEDIAENIFQKLN